MKRILIALAVLMLSITACGSDGPGEVVTSQETIKGGKEPTYKMPDLIGLTPLDALNAHLDTVTKAGGPGVLKAFDVPLLVVLPKDYSITDDVVLKQSTVAGEEIPVTTEITVNVGKK